MGEVLEDPHRIGCAEHGHRASEPDITRARCRSRKDYGGSRVKKLRPMVLSKPKDVQADLIRMLDTVEQFASSSPPPKYGCERHRPYMPPQNCQSQFAIIYLVKTLICRQPELPRVNINIHSSLPPPVTSFMGARGSEE